MGRGAKSVNDLLPPHERVFGITSYERARARSRSVSFTHTAPGFRNGHSCLQKGAIN